MEQLRQYLNSIQLAEQRRFAVRCGTTINNMRKQISINRPFNPVVCVSVEKESGGAVTRQDLREDWAEIWPELAETSGDGKQ